MKEVVLVKLGGSLITDKSKPFKAQKRVIKSLAQEIGENWDQDPDLNLVLGTGAGSYGHYPVMKYDLTDEVKTFKQKLGMAITQNGVKKLNSMLVEALVEEGVPAIGAHPSSMMVAKNKKIYGLNLPPLLESLENNLVPVVHGDIVPDKKIGGYIVSTEESFKIFTKEFPKDGFKVSKIIHATLEDGVLDDKGSVIPEINASNFNEISEHLTGGIGYDVTGGMKMKVEESLKSASGGVTIYIVSGRKKGSISKAIRGEKIGTLIQG